MKLVGIISLFFLSALPCMANAFDFPIYDTGELKEIEYFNKNYDHKMSRTELTTSEKTKFSSLVNSEAKVIECPKNVSNQISEDILSSNLFNRIFPRVSGIIHVNECVEIKYAEANIYVSQLEMRQQLLNPDSTYTWNIVEPIVWVGKSDEKKYKNIYFNVSVSYERSIQLPHNGTTITNIQAIADFTKDGRHDILIHDSREAGESYLLLKYEKGNFIIEDFPGYSWD